MTPQQIAIRRHKLTILGIFFEDEIADLSIKGRRHVRDRLAALCRKMGREGRMGLWTYSLPIHRATLAMYDAETQAVLALARAELDEAA